MSDRVPFSELGTTLKNLRERHHESVAEVCGAVEIDEPTLQKIEQGSERPSEDILMLLISHFGMGDDEAAGLWELAGYEEPCGHDHRHDHDHADHQHSGGPQPAQATKTTLTIIAVDPRVLYSDGVQVIANDGGVIVNFAQGTGTPQAMLTARVGMSREQAKLMLQALHNALSPPPPRQLPSSTHSSPSAAPPAPRKTDRKK